MHDCFAQEVIDTCVEIRLWLSGEGNETHFSSLLERFSPAFTMVTLSGAQIDYEGLQTFFIQARGSRPGLRIVIDELETLLGNEDGAVVSYRERQESALGGTTMRRSTAVFTRDAQGSVQWLRLQETPCL